MFGANFSWNDGIDTCFNVECVLLGRNFDFRGSYLVVTACYLVVTVHYLVFTCGYYSLPHYWLPTFSMNEKSNIVDKQALTHIHLHKF